MTKAAVSDWDLNPNNNLDVGGVPLGENVMLVGHVNDAFREMMAQIAAYRDLPAIQPSRRNLFVNPCFQISERNGDTAGTANGYYAADNWVMFKVGSGFTTQIQRVAQPSLNGSPKQLEIQVTAAKASLAAGDLSCISTVIEGYRISGLGWGTSEAVPLVDQVEVNLPEGVYYLHYSNHLETRNYCTPLVINPEEAGIPVRKSFSIPGDTSGTWRTDHLPGLVRDVILAAGTTYQGATDTWTNSVVYCGANQTNFVETTLNAGRIADCQLTPDPDARGVSPAWEPPDYWAQFLECQRYLPTIFAYNTTSPIGTGMATSATAGLVQVKFLVPTRVAPSSITVSGAGHLSGLNSSGTPVAATGIAFGNASQFGATLTLTGMSGLTAGHALPAQFNNASGKVVWLGAQL